MRLVSVLLLVFALLVSTSSVAQTVNYSGKSVTLQEVFSAIKKQTNYKFFYRNEDLDGLKRVTVELRNMALDKALQKVLQAQPLEFSIEGKTIFINRISERAAMAVVTVTTPPHGIVSGVVTDESNRHIPGITVLAKHSGQLAVSGEHGEFSLHDVPQGDTLVFTSINFETVVIPATFSENVVVLTAKITGLTEVRVYNNGYQQVSKERATGAFAMADMKVFQQRAVTNDILSRLDGTVPGLTVMPNSFSDNPSPNGVRTNKVVIRGISTAIGETGPVYVVNGVIVSDFANVNPQDVQDITVLKDAAAAAIYGARASNGVIVVRTREGQKRQPLEVRYAGDYTFTGKPDFGYIPQLNSAQFIQTSREIFSPQYYPYEGYAYMAMLPHVKTMFDEYRGLISATTASHQLDSMAGISNRGQINDLFYRNAMVTNHTVSASGGTENYSFYASLGYTGTQSNTPGQRNNTYKLNVMQNVNLGQRINISVNTSLINNVSSARMADPAGYNYLPYQLFRDALGNDIDLGSYMYLNDSVRSDYQDRSRVNLDYYPLRERQYTDSKSNSLFMNVTGNVNVKLWKGLAYTGTFGYIKNPGATETFVDHRSYTLRQQQVNFTIAPTVNDMPQYLLPVDGGTFITNTGDQRNWTVRNQLVYNASPRNGMDVLSVQVGQEAQEAYTSTSTSTLLGYDRQLASYPLVDYATLSQPVFGTVPGFAMLGSRPFEVFNNLNRYSSYFAMAGYTYDRRYTLEGSWRRDHSNLFGSDISAQNKPTFSVGGKWQLSNEAFMLPYNWINELGLRVSYGTTGNSPGNSGGATYDVLSVMAASNNGSIAGDAAEITNIANPKLSWEATRTTNIGVDFAFFKTRLRGGLNLYYKKTQDMLATLRLNRFSGFAVTLGNLGEAENKGIELGLQSVNLDVAGFRWLTNFNFAWNQNKLLSLGVTTASSYSNTPMGRLFSNHIPGRSMQALFAYRYAGLDSEGDPLVYLADKSTTKVPNAVNVKDMVYAGTTQPVFNGGFRNTFEYKGFSLALNMIYSLGHVMRADVPLDFTGQIGQYGGLTGQNIHADFLKRWKQPGDEATTDIPAYIADPYLANTRRSVMYYVYSDRNVLNASYIKLRDITLGYELPAMLLRRLQVKRASVMLQTGNYMVWRANDRNIDPEFISPRGGGRVVPPYKHSYSVGLNVTL